ncbi:MAG: formate dehydrogenase major subunit [Sphingomonadales bacterium]|nr:formate dehydrogenase major subunit [Sphingomonadales bacterium]
MTLTREADHGTSASPSPEQVTLTIDGAAMTVPAGTSIMRAASLAGTDIPRLCATDSMKAFGSCRICLVEIDGRPGTPASCTTPVAEGMAVATKSERLERLRKGVMELYLSDHPIPEQATEMREMAEMIGVAKSRYLPLANHLGAPCDTSNPYFDFDPSLCIVCSRCVRACDEVQGTFALTISGRGFGSHVSASQEEPFLASECVSCGACVTACPTGSLQEKAVKAVGLPETSTITTCA